LGFFASELLTVLRSHTAPADSPWDILRRLGVHEGQIIRLQEAAEDVVLIASLPSSTLGLLRQELNLSPLENARLIAGQEADVFFRLLIYHNYRLDEAVNKSNAVYAASLKDHLASAGSSDSIYPTVTSRVQGDAPAAKTRRPGRARAKSEYIPSEARRDPVSH
jgi:hypothetical protein